MTKTYIPPTRKEMNSGIMPIGKTPTIKQIREGALMPGKPFTISERRLMNKWGTDLKTAKKLEKEKTKKDKLSDLL